MKHLNVRSLALPAIAAGAIAILIAGCGQSEQKPEVASIETQGAPTSNSASAAASTNATLGIQIVRGDSNEKVTGYLRAYEACLVQHGAPTVAMKGPVTPVTKKNGTEALQTVGSSVPTEAPPGSDPEADAAVKACTNLFPIEAWERNTNNPERQKFVDQIKACFVREGIRFTEVKGMDYAFDASQIQDTKWTASEEKCEKEVYG